MTNFSQFEIIKTEEGFVGEIDGGSLFTVNKEGHILIDANVVGSVTENSDHNLSLLLREDEFEIRSKGILFDYVMISSSGGRYFEFRVDRIQEAFGSFARLATGTWLGEGVVPKVGRFYEDGKCIAELCSDRFSINGKSVLRINDSISDQNCSHTIAVLAWCVLLYFEG